MHLSLWVQGDERYELISLITDQNQTTMGFWLYRASVICSRVVVRKSNDTDRILTYKLRNHTGYVNSWSSWHNTESNKTHLTCHNGFPWLQFAVQTKENCARSWWLEIAFSDKRSRVPGTRSGIERSFCGLFVVLSCSCKYMMSFIFLKTLAAAVYVQ